MTTTDEETLTFQPGEVLFAPGAAAEDAFVVIAGRVIVEEGAGTAPQIVGPGEIIGEIDLLLGQPHSAKVVAIDPVSAVRLTRPQLAAAMRQTPHPATATAHAVFSTLARAVADTVATIDDAPEAQVTALDVVEPAGVTDWHSLQLYGDTREIDKQIDRISIGADELPFVVGRKPGRRESAPRQRIDLVLTDRKPYNMSRRHFVIDKGLDGLLIRDVGSLLGSEINGLRVGTGKPTNEVLLQRGRNVVAAGGNDTLFRFIVEIKTD